MNYQAKKKYEFRRELAGLYCGKFQIEYLKRIIEESKPIEKLNGLSVEYIIFDDYELSEYIGVEL